MDLAKPHHPLKEIDFHQSNQSYLLEASAGTGKTWTIEHLFIKALLEANLSNNTPISLHNILVVTFTNDATNELKERIQAQIQHTLNQIIYMNNVDYKTESNDLFTNYLKERFSNNNYQQDVQILNRALQNFDNASIFTIHGFCKRILTDYQFECQTNNQFELVGNRVEIISQLVRNFIRIHIINNPQLTNRLDQALNNLETFFSSSDYSLSLIEKISHKIPKDLFYIKDGKYAIRYNLEKPTISLENTLALNDTNNLSFLKAQFLIHLINFIEPNYAKECEQKNNFSYDELILKVADSIYTSDNLSDKLFNDYPVAFIDEFQDTDSNQWQIFSTIYHLTTKSPRGQIVVVGDPKQAIYSFRGADINTYLNARNHIDTHLKLVQNFRSKDNLVNFINQLFKSGDNQNYFGSEINYDEVTAYNDKQLQLPDKNTINELINKYQLATNFYTEDVQIVTITGKTKDVRQNNLLKSLTFEILALLQMNPKLKGKIAILVTKNREATEIINYLKQYNIQAAELKLQNIFATSSAEDLYRILFALFDLTNRQAFIRAISCNIFNFPLAKLNFNENNDYSANINIEKMQQNFFNYKNIWQSRGLFSLLYAIINDLININIDPHITNREFANFWQLAELLNKHDLRVNNHAELLLWFKNKIHKAQNNLNNDADLDGNNEELIRLDNDEEQILVTTQHKSKGLEFDIVFCPYFKTNITLDGNSDYNYRRPFFSSYNLKDKSYTELIMDKEIGEHVVNEHNREAHRLNYVALTRAKTRLYIYLKQPTLDKALKKYNTLAKPEKIAELFGYVKDNPSDSSHRLFDYTKLFSNTPYLAIKDPNILPGVIIYNRDLQDNDLNKLKLDIIKNITEITPEFYVSDKFIANPSYTRQSYSGLTRIIKDDNQNAHEYYIPTEKSDAEIEIFSEEEMVYRYTVLADETLSGATFGTLFHSLCERYPFTNDSINELLQQYNINNPIYLKELAQMLDEAFNYKILNQYTLSNLNPKIHELEFNLLIRHSVNFKQQIAGLISHHFGINHPFTIACQSLGTIEQGFLVGFIDLCFEHDGKYWVLDYKTNKLDEYNNATAKEDKGCIIESMADHHYYLQYMLYLVALKRYLEKRFKLNDATELIGGAIYYYVRGIYTTNLKPNDGIYIDVNCHAIIRELDLLLLSS